MKYCVNVVSTMSDYVNVYAENEKEAIEKAKYAISKAIETMNYDSEYIEYSHGGIDLTAEIYCDNDTCCICGNDKPNNNAAPYADGYCCDECNSKYVIPARIEKFFENRRAKQVS